MIIEDVSVGDHRMEDQQASKSDVVPALEGSSGGEVKSKTNLVYYDEIARSSSSLRKPSCEISSNREHMVFQKSESRSQG